MQDIHEKRLLSDAWGVMKKYNTGHRGMSICRRNAIVEGKAVAQDESPFTKMQYYLEKIEKKRIKTKKIV